MAEHIVSRKIYVAIFTTLIILTILTIIIAGIDLGPFNTIAALAIAAAKAGSGVNIDKSRSCTKAR